MGQYFLYFPTWPGNSTNQVCQPTHRFLCILRGAKTSKEDEIIRKRFNATEKVAWESKGEANLEVVEIMAEGKSLLVRMMSCVLLGDLVSLKLAEMNGVDPTPVTVIENLKTELDGK